MSFRISLDEKIELENKYPLTDDLWSNRVRSASSFGPFNDEKIGTYYVLHNPFDSSMPYVLTEKQYKSMLVTITHFTGTYSYDSLYWRRVGCR